MAAVHAGAGLEIEVHQDAADERHLGEKGAADVHQPGFDLVEELPRHFLSVAFPGHRYFFPLAASSFAAASCFLMRSLKARPCFFVHSLNAGCS